MNSHKQTQNDNLLEVIRKSIIDFDKSLYEQYYNSSKNNKGYIIDLNDFEEFKNKIIKGNCSNLSELIKKIKTIPFKTASYLINMISNNNKYIIINEELWKNICSIEFKDEHPIIYDIDSPYLFLNLDIRLKLFLSNKNNVIEKSCFMQIHNPNFCDNHKEIEEIYRKITKYFEFEKLFLKDLKLGCTKTYGYLVDKKWIDEWKEYTNYEYIKKEYLEKNIEEHIIKNKIIYQREENKNKFSKLKPIKIIEINEKEELESLLEMKILVILDYSFIYNLVPYSIHITSINYKLHYNKIEFCFYNDKNLLIDTNSNIISLNKSNGLEHIKQLIRIFYFEKELQNNLNLPYEELKNNKSIPDHVYLINNKFIEKYKNEYKSDILFDFLKNNESYNNINYSDLTKNYSNIIKSFKVANIEFFTDLEKIEKNPLSKPRFNSDVFDFNINSIKYKGNKTLIYIQNFKIISEDILIFFLKNKIIEDGKRIISKFLIGDGKVLIAFSYHNLNFYEIASIDESNNLIIEYIIEEKNQVYKENIISLFKLNGFKIFGEKNYVKPESNELKSNNLIIGYYYKIQQKKIIDKKNYPMDTIYNEDEEFIINVISFLLSLYLSEYKIKSKLISTNKNIINNNPNAYQKPVNINNKNKCYLINNNILTIIKTLFSYNKIKTFIDSNEINLYNIDKNDLFSKKNDEYIKLISTKINDFRNNTDIKNIFKFETAYFNDNQNKFPYPYNFNIIDKELFSKLMAILELQEIEIDIQEFFFNFNFDKIVLAGNENNHLNSKNNYLIYIYEISLEKNNMLLHYNIDLILSFNNMYILNNNFIKIINGKNIFNYYLGDHNGLDDEYKCKCHLMNKNIQGLISYLYIFYMYFM